MLTKHVHYVYDVFDHLLATEADTTGGGSYNVIQRYIAAGGNQSSNSTATATSPSGTWSPTLPASMGDGPGSGLFPELRRPGHLGCRR